ncbi:hypothetical protein A9G41_00075 [Gilliamella sp. Nev5-1]|uniref:hypothetical protein n=1 Tax=unclassified Gilliamella TaxID=2685620 RepID=UPI000827F825|nr:MULTISPECIES: hypothetical protein [Gilliamella]MCO6551123.1 hypothetical protein [Gilliamella sp.]OCG71135.1 hypothetical protein A9G41_00075 [Gilliamella apicola]
MAKNDSVKISQFDIDSIIKAKKYIDFNGASWNKKCFNAKDPAWLVLNSAVLDNDQLAIQNLRIEFTFKPALCEGLIDKMYFTAIYNSRRIFAVDHGQSLIHKNKYFDVIPTPPPIVTGTHYHIRHEKYNFETGYPIENIPKKDENNFSYFCNEFMIRFNTTAIGVIPHPYNKENEDKLL